MAGERPRLLVRGSINIDEFFVVDHIVRTGETISSTDYSRRAGGKGANQAVAAAKAGADVSFAGCIGSDGEWLKDELERYSVGTDNLHLDQSVPTGRALIQLSSSTRDNSIVLMKGANYAPLPREVSFESTAYTHVLLQNEIPWKETRRTLVRARDAGLVTVFNPSPMPEAQQLSEFEWDRLEWLLVNEGEAVDLLKALSSDGQTDVHGDEVLSRLARVKALENLCGIVMTRGSDGVSATFVRGPNQHRVVHSEAVRVDNVVDTTGAGDCFTGYFATLLARGQKSTRPQTLDALQAIINISAAAASMCVQKSGAMESVPSWEDVQRFCGEKGGEVARSSAMVS